MLSCILVRKQLIYRNNYILISLKNLVQTKMTMLIPMTLSAWSKSTSFTIYGCFKHHYLKNTALVMKLAFVNIIRQSRILYH